MAGGVAVLLPASSSREIHLSHDDGSAGIAASCRGDMTAPADDDNDDNGDAVGADCLPLPHASSLFVGPSLHLPSLSQTYNRFTHRLAVQGPDGSLSRPHWIVRVASSSVTAWAAARLRSWATDRVAVALHRSCVFDGDGQRVEAETLVRVRERDMDDSAASAGRGGSFLLECWVVGAGHVRQRLQEQYALTMMPIGRKMDGARMFLVLDMDLKA